MEASSQCAFMRQGRMHLLVRSSAFKPYLKEDFLEAAATMEAHHADSSDDEARSRLLWPEQEASASEIEAELIGMIGDD